MPNLVIKSMTYSITLYFFLSLFKVSSLLKKEGGLLIYVIGCATGADLINLLKKE